MAADEFDYVVVGAGSAGCVLAARLSEAGDRSVLVLEAGGPDDRREIEVPAAFTELYGSEVDWGYHTEPQPELGGRECYWPRGRAVGGTSSMNAMIYVRGHRTDFDRWAEEGNAGWAYEDVLPAFTRGEAFTGSGGDPAYHGTDGPLSVTDQRSPRALSESFVAAAERASYDRKPDFNGARQAGFGRFHVTQRNGRRHSLADAYLKPALDRANLTAETGALVSRVRIEGGRAVGVTYERDGREREVDAAEEVLVCAGAVDSPALLMRSGVGPADHLVAHGIAVERDRSGVGRNLQDHLVAPVVYEATTTATLDDAVRLPKLALNLARYYVLDRGPLTSNLAEAGGFVRTDDGLDAPDLELLFVPAFMLDHGRANPDRGHGFSLGPVLLRPESRGRVTLRSADPREPPAIDPRYLSEPADLDALVEGVEFAREIARTEPLAGVRGAELQPGDDTGEADLAAFVRERAHTLYHPVGTCRMGDDDRAVVDDRLRVHGVEGLRVADASVMPSIVGGHTNAPTVMIAERAAELIRADAGG